jgi:hypothetical protein
MVPTQNTRSEAHKNTESRAEFRPSPMCFSESRRQINLRTYDGQRLELAQTLSADEIGELQFTGQSTKFRYDAGQGSNGEAIQLSSSSSRQVLWHQVEFKGQKLWVIDSVVRPCPAGTAPAGGASSSGLLPLPIAPGETPLPSRPAIAKQWLDGNPRASGFSVSNPVFLALEDRCQAGLLLYGDRFCMVHAKGSPNSEPPPLKSGKNSFGEPCEYPVETVENGSTPINPPPSVDLQMGRTGNDPKSNLGAAQRVMMSGDWPPGRDALVVHAGREKEHKAGGQKRGLDFNIESFNTWGCIRTRESCQEEFANWVRANPNSATLTLREFADDSGLSSSIRSMQRGGNP